MNKRIKILLILTMSIMVSFYFYGCKDWDHNVVKNGIHFKKIHQSKSGINIGYMTESHNIQGFPCEKGWIHFKKDWKLLSFQLSQDFIYNSTLLLAHTWFHLPYDDRRTGYICSFPNDFTIQGYICGGSGGYKGIQTGFYDSGKLRSFFPPADVIVKGVPCEASLLASVNLYENGNIKSCKLAEDYHEDGKTYKKGKIIEFDENGKVK